jgi:DUF1009 family protein
VAAEPIGLIAGNGTFPLLVLRAARARGHDVAVVAIQGEAHASIDELAVSLGGTSVRWLPAGELAQCIALLRAAGVTQAVMAGLVRHASMFRAIRPDATLRGALAGLQSKNTDALVSAVAAVLQQHGIGVMDSTALLSDLLAAPGLLTRAAPSDAMLADFAFGYAVADAVAGLDIGQTIVVKDLAVVAVEAMEGTDDVIARAGGLAGAGARVVKVANPAQDMRFDVPVVGVRTIERMQAAGADGLSIDAGKTLILDGAAVIDAADRAGIVIVGRPRP